MKIGSGATMSARNPRHNALCQGVFMSANLELMRAGLDAKINKEAAPLGKSSQ